jgi:hypothetical protein
MNELQERVEKYIKIEEEALKKIRIIAPKDSYSEVMGRDAMEMIISYFSDAKYFYSKGDFINAFAAINYSYGWIDSMIRIGIFDGDSDHRLFTLFR